MDLLISRYPSLAPVQSVRPDSPPAEVINIAEIKASRKKAQQTPYEYNEELTEVENYIEEALNTDRLTVNKLRQMTKDLL